MASSTELMLLAKARRRRAEAEGAAASGGYTGPTAENDYLDLPVPANANAPAAAPEPAEPGWLEQALGVGQQALYGASQGAVNVLGLPGDLADIIPDGVPIMGQLKHGLPTGGEISDFLGYDNRRDPEGWLETIFNRVGEEVGASALPVAGVTGKAVQMGLPAVRQMGGAGRYLLEPAAVDPTKFVAKEMAATAAAGTGAGVANTLVDRDTTAGQWADLLGAFGGVGVAAAGEGIMRSLGDVLAGITANPKFASQVVRENAADTLIANSDVLGGQIDPARPHEPVDTTALIDLLEQPANAENVIPGFRASTADRGGDFGLASFEDARARGPNAARFRARQEANTEAVDTQLNTSAPTERPAVFFDALEQERTGQLAAADRTVQEALAALEQALGPLNVPVDSTLASRGNTVRTGLLDAREAAQNRTSAAYDAADTSGNMVDPAELRETLDGALAGMTQTELTHVPEGVINRVRALGVAEDGATPQPVDLREATTLLSEIKELRRAAVNDGKRNANRVLGQVEDALDNFITANVTPEQQTALDAARAARYDEAERFGRPGDPVTAAVDVHPGGRFKMRDDRVAPSFASSDSNLERLFTEADTPEVREAIKQELLTRLDSSSTERIGRFADTYRQQIARFPGLEDELMAAADARDAEGVARLGQQGVQRHLGDPQNNIRGRSAVGRFLEYSPEQADDAVSQVLNSKNPIDSMDELMTFVGDEPSAIEGARAAFWRVMEKEGRSKNAAFETKSGVAPWMPKKWRTFLADEAVSGVMDRLYRDNPEHLQNIRQIAEALRGVNTGAKAGAAINPSGSAQTLRNSPVTLAEAQAKFIDVQRGRLNPAYAITYLAGKLAHRLVSKQAERSYQMLLDEALLNPQVAADLLKQNNPANRAALARSAKAYLGNEASHLAELLDDDENGDE